MRIFIGSASESVKTANQVKYLLCRLGHTVKVWNEIGIFIPSTYTIQNLERIVNDFDAAVFVCTEDDIVKTREQTVTAVRDNTIFESGLFTSALGHEKVAFYMDGDPKLPSDLKGITVIKASDNLADDEKNLNEWINSVMQIDNSNSKDKITMLPRYLIDNRSVIEERWKYAKEITFINFASTAFIASQRVVPSHVAKGSLRELFQQKLADGCNFKFLITEPDSYADFEASKSKMNILPNNGIEISDIIRMAYIGLEDEINNLHNSSYKKGTVEYKTTNIALPYGLVLVTNDDEHSSLNHIKVDLYSPYLSNDRERRSFIVYQDNINYGFFYEQISTLWKRAKERQNELLFTPRKISGSEIENAIRTIYRQYFVGDLHKEQILNHIYDSKIEIGTSLYKEFTVDEPHYHKYATEYIYVLEGIYKLAIKSGSDFIFEELKAGDFYMIPKHTPYASKATQGTRVLFIKTPGLNDKSLCRKEDFMDFVSRW